MRNYITGILDICQDQKGPVGSLSSEILNFIIVTDIKEDDTTDERTSHANNHPCLLNHIDFNIMDENLDIN